MGTSDRDSVVDLYHARAGDYDRSLRRLTSRYRSRAIDRLWLTFGDAVLDVACGTGLSLPLLAERVGPSGRVVGIDLSPDMLAVAAERVGALSLDNVTLLEIAVEDAHLEDGFEAALFSLTHDVLQSKPALDNVFARLRRGGRVAAFGAKSVSRWNLPVHFYVHRLAGRYMTSFEGFEAPWRNLAQYLDSLSVEELGFGGAYIASGVASGRTRRAGSGRPAQL